ncbi:MAG: amidohydrolase family protein [Candidatus Latescibacteria bacterium]|nr:amidohydrolase family protein [Candidatus Latescibacterota bacterium]
MTVDGYCTLGVDREFDLTEDGLLEAMDRAEVDRAVIVPVDRCLAVRNREGNAEMRSTASRHHDRFIPACSVNPWYGEGALDEMSRAVGDGARILVLHPFVQGYQANDELVWPLLEAAGTARLPVYVHTGPPGNATPWQVIDLVERFAETDLIIGHCGATDLWNDMVEAAKASDRVSIESSLARPFQFYRYVEEAGQKKGIAGSYAPINDLAFEWSQMRKVLPRPLWDDVCGGNLLRLLEKRGAL